MTIEQMRDALSEARRYARTDPDAACELASWVGVAILDGHGRFPDRLSCNLSVGIQSILSDPEVFTSYCYAVSHELLSAGAP